MTYSISGIAPGSDETLSSAGHYKMLDTIQAFACGQLLEDSYSGAGNGKLVSMAVMSTTAPEETWTLTCTAAAADGGTFSVVGSISGVKADATVGVLYTDGANIQFQIQDGSVDYAVNDAFTLSTADGARVLYRTVYAGTGNGKVTQMALLSQVAETWTLTCTAISANSGTFSVAGSVSGPQANATVGVGYNSGGIRFLINDGTADFALNDSFTLVSDYQAIPLADRWTVLEYVSDGVIPELLLEGPGIAGVGKVYVGFQTVQHVANDYYNIVISGFETYIPGNSYDSQYKIYDRTVPLWQFDVGYQMRITARSIWFGTKVESQYDITGAGMYLAYYDPGQYPYPMFIAGSLPGKSTTRYSDTVREWGIGYGELYVLWLDGTWFYPEQLPYYNWTAPGASFYEEVIEPTKTSEVTNYTGTGNGALGKFSRLRYAPNETWSIVATSATNFTVNGTVSGAQADATVGVAYDNGIIRFTLEAGGIAFVSGDEFTAVTDLMYGLEKVVLGNDAKGNMGELEGVSWVTGFGQAVENSVIDENGNTNHVIRNIARTGFHNYCTLLLD